MYKLIAVDLDGTLLDDNKDISKETIESIKKAVEMGVYFVLSSGRPIITQMRFYNKIGVNMPMIACNGAIIAYPDYNNIIINEHFNKDVLIDLVEYFNNKNKSFIAWSNNDLYCNKVNKYTTSYHDACKHANVNIKEIKDYNKFYDSLINKMIVIDDSDNIQMLIKDVKEDINNKCNYFTSQSYFLEFVPEGIDKGIAIEKLAKYLDIKKEEIIAIGDGFNDLPMFEHAGLKVAMANASKYVKSKSNYITSDNNSNGVKEVIDKFVLGDNNEKR